MPNEPLNRISELDSRLRLLKKIDWRLRVFGACGHAYRFRPPLQDWYVDEIESNYGISLPEDYRNYLLNLANGGAGPYYGLISLQEALLDSPKNLSHEFLSAPFPHTSEFNPSREENTEDEELGSIHVQGSIPIAYAGCGGVFRLVISGPQREMIWQDERANDKGLIPVGLSFYEWYDKWLTHALASLKVGLFSRFVAMAYRACNPKVDPFAPSAKIIYPKI